ncbi:MAG: tetratricopeptide repeat protein [Bacteroidaceae bacterium]|nr:tetratricopeptide repeat protein [Bacteroidaceae bacterium]
MMLISLFCVVPAVAQSSKDAVLRSFLRAGNRFFHQGNYDKAEAEYLKAYEIDSTNVHVLYNLGTTYLMKQEPGPANQKLVRTIHSEEAKNRIKGARIFHNLGVNLQITQEYDKAISAYKQSLRLNPSDEETRYNLALCQKLRKDNPQDKNQQNQQQQQQQQEEQKEDQQQQNQDQKPQPQEQQPPQDQMSKENAQQLLEAVKQDEKAVKERMNQQVKNGTRRKKEKDW